MSVEPFWEPDEEMARMSNFSNVDNKLEIERLSKINDMQRFELEDLKKENKRLKEEVEKYKRVVLG